MTEIVQRMPSDQNPKKPAALARGRARKERTAEVWRDDDVIKARQTLLKSLNATKKFFDKETKDYIEVPDWIARIAGANALIANKQGLPVQRVAKFEMNFQSADDKLVEMCKSQEGKRFLLANGFITPDWLKSKGLTE